MRKKLGDIVKFKGIDGEGLQIDKNLFLSLALFSYKDKEMNISIGIDKAIVECIDKDGHLFFYD